MSWMWRCFYSKTTFVILPDMPRHIHALIYYTYLSCAVKKNKRSVQSCWSIFKLISFDIELLNKDLVKIWFDLFRKISIYIVVKFHLITYCLIELTMYVAKSTSVLLAWVTKHAVFPSSPSTHNCLLRCTKQFYICSVLEIFRGRATQKLDAIIEKDLIFPVMVTRHLKILLSCVSKRL